VSLWNPAEHARFVRVPVLLVTDEDENTGWATKELRARLVRNALYQKTHRDAEDLKQLWLWSAQVLSLHDEGPPGAHSTKITRAAQA